MFRLFLMPFIATLLFSFPASAARISVDFATEGSFDEDLGHYQYLYGDQNLTIKPYFIGDDIIQSDVGLGINDPYVNRDEGMSLFFSAPVKNLILALGNWDPAKDTLLAGTPETGQMCFGYCPLRILTANNTGENGVFQFSGAITELAFGIPGYADDTVTSLLSVSWDDGSPSVVPLPAALPLYAAGMGLMGLMGWRKRRKSAA